MFINKWVFEELEKLDNPGHRLCESQQLTREREVPLAQRHYRWTKRPCLPGLPCADALVHTVQAILC